MLMLLSAMHGLQHETCLARYAALGSWDMLLVCAEGGDSMSGGHSHMPGKLMTQ